MGDSLAPAARPFKPTAATPFVDRGTLHLHRARKSSEAAQVVSLPPRHSSNAEDNRGRRHPVETSALLLKGLDKRARGPRPGG